ncbi:MAG: 16S rRNA (cytosine(1402)-N(4))-methyltransferase RsmH [Propionibacteriaceae bacterium]|jgi:16S rRNA (cytosine1402-N4)-methyltransferase|nr:16S rRNA (cytosine(1402)-N(4))-methyltransferase RsmH [Propionibacteriaceae bacterium]
MPTLATTSDGRVLHTPVLCERIVELLSPALTAPADDTAAVLVDCTLGMGGHATELLSANPQAQLIGIDRDSAALEIAAQQLAPFGDRVRLVQAGFAELATVLSDLGIRQVAAVLADLGLSSLQIADQTRGFAYASIAPLDMRMDTRQTLSAAEIVNTWSAAELARIFTSFGEERFATRIAAATVAARPITDSAQLAMVVRESLPAALRYGEQTGHPAKRVAQALRIAVNGELEQLSALLPSALARLQVGGRLAVLSYHSLEDRLVKRAFTQETTDNAPAGLPVVPQHYQAKFRLLTKGAERPTATESANNPRAKSARLRAVQRIKEA